MEPEHLPWLPPPPRILQTSTVDEYVKEVRSLQETYHLSEHILKSYFLNGLKADIRMNMSEPTLGLNFNIVVQSARRIEERINRFKEGDGEYYERVGRALILHLGLEEENVQDPIGPIGYVRELGSDEPLDIDLFRDNPEVVRDRLRRKGHHSSLHLVDEVIKNDERFHHCQTEVDAIRKYINRRNREVARLDAAIARREEVLSLVETNMEMVRDLCGAGA